jgi:hypothetical protein
VAEERYDFELLVEEATTAARRSIYLPDLKAAWPHIADMAAGAQRGARIRVLDRHGRIVILTGVASARIASGNALVA